MKHYSTLWWTTAQHWAQIAQFSPLVIGQRVLDMATAGPQPSAAHQQEMTNMMLEKSEAIVETSTAVWLAALHGQNVAWQRAWRAGRPVPMPEDFQLAASTAERLGRALGPVSRRVAANAKRLSRRKQNGR